MADRVIAVADGDTLTVLRDNVVFKVRLANIDAPERRQAYGKRSRQSLADLCFGKRASTTSHTHDRYGRMVATVHCEGVDVNRRQVELGMAWVYTKYNLDPSLPPLEVRARSGRRGLWGDSEPLPPWQFRLLKKARVSEHGGGRGTAVLLKDAT